MSNIDISGSDLSGQDVSHADVSSPALAGQDVSVPDVSCADVSAQDVSHADVSSPALAGQDVSVPDVSYADVSAQDVSHADVSVQDLSGQNAYCQGNQIVGERCVCAKTTCDKALCVCGEPATMRCSNCERKICDDNNCGSMTVDGYLCGTYTQWGCGKKYTTCDECLEDAAIHEGDMIECGNCGIFQCEACDESHECEGESEDKEDMEESEDKEMDEPEEGD
jgi:hypothetical protein